MSANSLLKKGASELGVSLSELQMERFMMYLDLLKRWSVKINLTSVKGDGEIVVKHFLDSISAAPHIGGRRSLLDIGSGAGFPGIPIAITRPETETTLLDSSNKKIAFMREVIRKLGLDNARAVRGRAEEPTAEMADKKFDAVITRAVGSIADVLKLSAPYTVAGGAVILMRGARELEDSDPARYGFTHGLSLTEREEITLPGGGQSRVLLIFNKD